MENNIIQQCSLCDVSYKFDSNYPDNAYKSFLSHLRKKHNTTRKEYIKLGHQIDQTIEQSYIKYTSDKNKVKVRSTQYIENENKKLLNKLGHAEFNRYPKCAICGYVRKQLFNHIFKLHNMSTEEYNSAHPNSHLALPEYYEYLSTTRSGDLNPMFNNGSTKTTPFHPDFYVNKGYSLEEAQQMTEAKKKEAKESITPEMRVTRPEYYMKKHGVDYAKAVGMVSRRQKTNTVENIAKRNNISIEEAKKVRIEITKKWCNTLASKSESEIIEMNKKKMDSRSSVSKVSLKFINALLKYTNINKEDVQYGENEFAIVVPSDISMHGHKCLLYDFKYGNKIVEFNGDLVHANPVKYNPDDIPPSRYNRYSKTSKEVWEYDANKIKIANMNGYEVHTIWEYDWKHKKQEVLESCKAFLLGETINGDI